MTIKAKTAFITGGGGDIGKAMALSLGRQGVAAAVADLDEKAALAVAAEIQKSGVTAVGLKMDVTRKASVLEAVRQANERIGPIDVLANCAGIYPHSFVTEMAEAEWDRVIDVNLKGTFLACQAVSASMQQRRFGKIITISSGHGFKGGAGTAHYSASKAGVVVFTKSLALELAPYGINVNCLAPGLTDTAMPHRVLSDETLRDRAAKNPMGRIGLPQDIANALMFLVSEESSYINGQTIYVNGGALMP
jgi:NAD(P)-dependent dehydrogenase (short-subunit alcohol dehydrogenase family)